LNRPDLTEQRFIQNPFEPQKSSRLYRTGDLARILTNGDLEYLGRMDHQVKIRGFRIELQEIESILARLPAVKECAVLARTDSGTEPRLVAYLVTDSDASLRVEDMRTHLAEELPDYMVPSAFVFLDAFPLTLNGKLDREALPAPGSERPRLASEYVAPQTDLEKMIAGLWQEQLRQDAIGVNDDFISLGADSLMLTSVHLRLERELKREIPGTDFLQFPTIRSLAQHLEQKAGSTTPAPIPQLMTCLQPGKEKPPFFFAHGDWIYGGLYCKKIVQQLDADQPFYTLAPRGTFGRSPPSSFEEAAAEYVHLMRSVQPKGPYYLGGFCNGAIAIYEVAQQLVRAGETVAALVLLDPPDLDLLYLRKVIAIGNFLGLPERRLHGVYLRIANGLEVWKYYGLVAMLSDGWTESIRLVPRLVRLRQKNQAKPVEPAASLSLQDLTYHYYELMSDYKPKANLNSKSTWIVLRQGDRNRSSQQTAYWSRFIPNTRIEFMSGNHLDLSTNVGEIAQIIRATLNPNA
jgi:thioesterase domain-containing protein/acyl carrier protein